MDEWLRVKPGMLLIELAVVGVALFALLLLFLMAPMPAWMPAIVLWGITVGFVVYRMVSRPGRREASTVRRSAPSAERGARPVLVAPPWQPPADDSAVGQESDDYRDTVAVDAVPHEVLENRAARPIRTPEDAIATNAAPASEAGPSSEQGSSAEDEDDLRATLFDVPSVGQTGDAFERMAVFTEEEYALAQSETELLDAVDSELSKRWSEAPTIAMDRVDTEEEDAIDAESVRERAPTLDEDTWRRMQEEAGG